jgi:hypothetical protein
MQYGFIVPETNMIILQVLEKVNDLRGFSSLEDFKRF